MRDDRYPLPGAPFWYVLPETHPVSVADGASVGLEGWLARTWSFSTAVYARSFHDVPRWRPTGTRQLGELGFDDGRTIGVEAMLRRHEGLLTGWIGYGLGRVQLTEAASGTEYGPAWDRRHSLDVALFLRPSDGLTLSARATYGSGTPFWPIAGQNEGLRFDALKGMIQEGEQFPVWTNGQMRFPAFARIDVGARRAFRLGRAEGAVYLSVLNVLARPNVFFYEIQANDPPTPSTGVAARLEPVSALPFLIPTLGFDVHF